MRPKREYFIYSPGLDQSWVIARLLKRAEPDAKLIGVVLPGERRPPLRRVYSSYASYSETLDASPGAIHIPTGARSTSALLAHGDVTLGSITLTRDALRTYDKLWLLEEASKAGVPVPDTATRAQSLVFPLFFKGRYEGAGAPRGIARSSRDLVGMQDGRCIFQELISSRGTYGVGFLAAGGALLATHCHYEAESFPQTGGSGVIVDRVENPTITRLTERLVRRIRYSGWGLAEFKFCPKRCSYVLMELNAKFWASCELAFLNEPLFLEALFGVHLPGAEVARMLFLNRAILRGPRFVMERLPRLEGPCMYRSYPGLSLAVICGLRRCFSRRWRSRSYRVDPWVFNASHS